MYFSLFSWFWLWLWHKRSRPSKQGFQCVLHCVVRSPKTFLYVWTILYRRNTKQLQISNTNKVYQKSFIELQIPFNNSFLAIWLNGLRLGLSHEDCDRDASINLISMQKVHSVSVCLRNDLFQMQPTVIKIASTYTGFNNFKNLLFANCQSVLNTKWVPIHQHFINVLEMLLDFITYTFTSSQANLNILWQYCETRSSNISSFVLSLIWKSVSQFFVFNWPNLLKMSKIDFGILVMYSKCIIHDKFNSRIRNDIMLIPRR